MVFQLCLPQPTGSATVKRSLPKCQIEQAIKTFLGDWRLFHWCYVLRALLAKIYNAINHIYWYNFTLKLCSVPKACLWAHTRTNFQFEILTSTISAIHKFWDNILESSLKDFSLAASLHKIEPCLQWGHKVNQVVRNVNLKPWLHHCTRLSPACNGVIH